MNSNFNYNIPFFIEDEKLQLNSTFISRRAFAMGSIFILVVRGLILGLATFPITFVTLRHLPDKGYFFSKILALMMMGYLTWIFGYVSFKSGTIFFTFLILVGISGLLIKVIGPGLIFLIFSKKKPWAISSSWKVFS